MRRNFDNEMEKTKTCAQPSLIRFFLYTVNNEYATCERIDEDNKTRVIVRLAIVTKSPVSMIFYEFVRGRKPSRCEDERNIWQWKMIAVAWNFVWPTRFKLVRVPADTLIWGSLKSHYKDEGEKDEKVK